MADPILFSDSDFVIADKAHGMPTVPLKGQSAQPTLLGLVAERFPDVMEIRGRNEWEHGAVHRLDTATSGLVLFARTQSFYDHIQKVQAEDLFGKTYLARTVFSDRLRGPEQFCPPSGSRTSITSYFRSFGPGSKQVRPTLDLKRADSAVLYTTALERVSDEVFRCTITRGFRHQIRAQLAWIGHPIVGDPLYGTGTEGETLELDCIEMAFPLPDGTAFRFGK